MRICAFCREPWPVDCICPDEDLDGDEPQDGSDEDEPGT